MLRLCLSGPVEVLVRETPVDLGPPQRRAVLAALAVDAGRPVPIEVLIDRIWGADPPTGARRALYAHIARLRRLAERLDDVGEGQVGADKVTEADHVVIPLLDKAWRC